MSDSWASSPAARKTMLGNRGRDTEAIEVLERALAMEDDAVTRFNLGFLYHNQKRMPEAIGQFRQVVTAMPVNDRAWYGLGICLQEMGDFAGSVEPLQEAVVLDDPDDRTRVVDQVLDLVGGRRVVDRDRRGTEHQDRDVEHVEVSDVAHHQHDAVATLDALRLQATGDASDELGHIGERPLLPFVALLPADGDVGSLRPHHLEEGGSDGLAGGAFGDGGHDGRPVSPGSVVEVRPFTSRPL